MRRRLFTTEELRGPYIGPNQGPPETESDQNLLILHHEAYLRRERASDARDAWDRQWGERERRLLTRAANLLQRNIQHVRLIGSSAPTIIFARRLTLNALRRARAEFRRMRAYWQSLIHRLHMNMYQYFRHMADGRPILFAYDSDGDDI